MSLFSDAEVSKAKKTAPANPLASQSLFGASDLAAAKPKPAAPSLFGASDVAAAKPAAPSLFGASEVAAVKPAVPSPLARPAAAAPSLFAPAERAVAPAASPLAPAAATAVPAAPAPTPAAPKPAPAPRSQAAAGQTFGSATVTEPQKEGGISSKHTTYLVAGELLTAGARAAFSGRKRFSDFEWLRTALLACFPGVLVPVLPQKGSAYQATMNRFEASVVEERRAGLEEFLRRVFRRRALAESPAVRAFLTTTDQVALDAAKKDVDARSLCDVLRDYQSEFGHQLQACPQDAENSQFAEMRSYLERCVPPMREAVNSVSLAVEEHRKAFESEAAAIVKLKALSEDEARSATCAQLCGDARADLVKTFGQKSQICGEGANDYWDTLAYAVRRDVSDAQSMDDAMLSIDSLHARVQEIKKRGAAGIQARDKLMQTTGATPQEDPRSKDRDDAIAREEAKEEKEGEPAAASGVKAKLGGIGSSIGQVGGSIAGSIGKKQSLDDLNKAIGKDTEDAVAGEELLRIARALCGGHEMKLYLEAQVASQHFLRDDFAGRCAIASKQQAVLWSGGR